MKVFSREIGLTVLTMYLVAMVMFVAGTAYGGGLITTLIFVSTVVGIVGSIVVSQATSKNVKYGAVDVGLVVLLLFLAMSAGISTGYVGLSALGMI